MPVIYSTAVKTDRMQAVADAIDEGTGAGTIEVGTASMAAVLAIFQLPEPCGTVSGDTLTFDMDPDLETTGEDAASTGTNAVEARIKNGDGTVVVSGLSVGTSDADIILDSVNIADGQTAKLTAGTITHAADPT